MLQQLVLCTNFRDGLQQVNEAIREAPTSAHGYKNALDAVLARALAEKYAPKALKQVCQLLDKAFRLLLVSGQIQQRNGSGSDDDEDMENQMPEMSFRGDVEVEEQALRFVQFAIGMVEWYVDTVEKPQNSVFPVLLNLHDHLLALSADKHLGLQDAIARACEQWFIHELPDREQIAPQAISFLLMRSIAPSAKHADIKRVYGMREALALFDYTDESSESLRDLILFAFVCPSFVRTADGRKFLAFAMCLHHTLIAPIHEVVKSQLAAAQKGLVSSYSDIYFRAWKSAEEPCLSRIEYVCIQDVMNQATHASNHGPKPTPATKLRLLLEKFHTQKKIAGVDEMLCRLYTPIIWRALNAANAQVRVNAVLLLVDAFPLRNPDATAEEFEELLQRQFDALTFLLKDPSPIVRAAAVQGLCRVFAIYWELIPKDVLSDGLSVICSELAYDAASPDVRLAVIQGLHYLLENAPLSHTSLRRHLTAMGKLLHDASLKNRVAFVEMLLVVKDIPDIKFWDVIDLPHLLFRMELDPPEVSKRIVSLLMSSFFPLKKDTATRILRTTVLIKKNPAAARRFFHYLPKYAPLPTVVSYTIELYKGLRSVAATKKSKSKKQKKVKDVILTDEVLEAIKTHFEALLDLVAVLVDKLVPLMAEEGNEESKTRIVDCFEHNALVDLAPMCNNDVSQAALYSIASHALAANVVELTSKCQEALMEGSEVSSSQASILDAFFSWGLGDQILEAVVPLLEFRRKVEDSDLLALDYVHLVLSDADKRQVLFASELPLASVVEKLSEGQNFLLDSLKSTKADHLEVSSPLGTLLRRFFKVLSAFHVHLAAAKEQKIDEAFLKVLESVFEAIPVMIFASDNVKSSNKRKESDDSPFLYVLFMDSMELYVNLAVFQIIDAQTAASCSTHLIRAIKNDVDLRDLEKLVPRFISSFMDLIATEAKEGTVTDYAETVANVVDAWVLRISNDEAELTKRLNKVASALQGLLLLDPIEAKLYARHISTGLEDTSVRLKELLDSLM